MASPSDLDRAAKKGKRKAENNLAELTNKGEQIEALMKECEDEVVANNCDAVPCPCSSCLGCYMRLIPKIERHLCRHGPGPSEKVTVGKRLMWKCFDAGMEDYLEYQDSQIDRNDSILLPHSIGGLEVRNPKNTEVTKMISIVSHGHLLSALNSISIPSDVMPKKRCATKSCKRVVYSSDLSMDGFRDEEYDPKRANKHLSMSQPHVISIDVVRENLETFFINKKTKEIQETLIPTCSIASRRKIRAEEMNSEGPIKVETKDGRPVGPHKERYVQRIRYLVKSRLDLWCPSILKCPSVQIDSIKSTLQATFDCDVSEKYLNDKLAKTFRALKNKVLDDMAKDESQEKEPTKPDWLSEEKWMKMKDLKNLAKFKEKNLGMPLSSNEVFVEAHTYKCKDRAKNEKLNCYAKDVMKKFQEGEGTSNFAPNYFGSVSRGSVSGCGLGIPMSPKKYSKIEKERNPEEKFQEMVQIEVSNVLSKILEGNNLLATSLLRKIREATDVQPQAHQVSSQVSSSPCAKVANTSHKDVVAHNIERNELPLECAIGHVPIDIQEKNDFSVLQTRKTKKKDRKRM